MFPKADGTPGDYSLDAKVANNNVANEGWNLMVSISYEIFPEKLTFSL